MSTTLTFAQLFTHIVGDMATALGTRPGDAPPQKLARIQAATQMIFDLYPRDIIEAMLAGHIVMFHEIMTASVREALTSEATPARRATRAAIIATNKAFHQNLTLLEDYRRRPSQGQRDLADARLPPDNPPPVEAPVETIPAVPSPNVAHAAQKPVPPAPRDIPPARKPTPETIAARRADPAAIAALDAGDHAALARVLGFPGPGDGCLTATGRPFPGPPPTVPPPIPIPAILGTTAIAK